MDFTSQLLSVLFSQKSESLKSICGLSNDRKNEIALGLKLYILIISCSFFQSRTFSYICSNFTYKYNAIKLYFIKCLKSNGISLKNTSLLIVLWNLFIVLFSLIFTNFLIYSFKTNQYSFNHLSSSPFLCYLL